MFIIGRIRLIKVSPSLSNAQQHYMDSNIPCVLVASKVDLPDAKQFHGMTPAEFCYKHRLPPPLPFSSLLLDSTTTTGSSIYSRLAWAAMYPYVPSPPTVKRSQLRLLLIWLFCPPVFQPPERLRHEQRLLLAESGSGLGGGCCSGFRHLSSRIQAKITSLFLNHDASRPELDHVLFPSVSSEDFLEADWTLVVVFSPLLLRPATFALC